MAIADLLGRLQQPGLMGAPAAPLPGVSTVFDTGNTIAADLQRQVALELERLDVGQSTALLNVHTQQGVNLVVASRINDKLTATAWIGKSGWDRPVREGWEGAVSLRASWGGTK